ncbi:hypothetical protein [Burkholderia ambifaria]|uniref:hypothetical protein n=1 Tax=Burkholderia ambifaria TaxID=152480 RepID=UPI001589B40A|nr:hypothetical protein [Burkholderia ambifaria]
MGRTSKYAVACGFTRFVDRAFAYAPRGVAAFASIAADIQLVAYASIAADIQLVAYASIVDRTATPESA